MNITQESNRKNSWPMQFCLVAFALISMLPGFAQAQDFDAVTKRLVKAVKHDEITLEQAAIMIEALRDSAHDREHDEDLKHHDGEHADRDDREREFRDFAGKMEEALEAGKITRKEFDAKVEDFKKKLGSRNENKLEQGINSNVSDVGRIIQLFKAGEITREEATEKLNALKDGKAGAERPVGKADGKARYRAAEIAIVKMMADGKLTREQAAEKLLGLKKLIWTESDENKIDDREERFRKAAMEMQEAVRAGKISKEEAGKKLAGVKKELWADKKGKADGRKDQSELDAIKRDLDRMFPQKITPQSVEEALRESRERVKSNSKPSVDGEKGKEGEKR